MERLHRTAASRSTSRSSVGYVGTEPTAPYADLNLNYAESGGNANRQLFAQAGNASINDWAGTSRARYNSLQMAVNRPFKGGLLLEGRLHASARRMNETDDDGWVGLTWNQPSQLQPATTRWRASIGRTTCRWASCTSCRSAQDSTAAVAPVVKDWQVNGIASWLSGKPFSIGGDNGLLQQAGGFQSINVVGTRSRVSARPGPNEQWYEPGGVRTAGQRVGQQRPQRVPRPVELEPGRVAVPHDSVRSLPCGDSRRVAERVQPRAVGHPVTGFTDPNFMRIRTLARAPRTVQLGTRLVF